MKIVVLDGHTLNDGDLSWQALETLGPCTVYPRTAPQQVAERCADAELVLTNKVVLDAQQLQALPRLRYIGVLATGYNVVDLEAARRQGIVVTNVPAYSTDSVAQMVFALLLEWCQQVGHHNRRVHEGAWSGCVDFTFRDTPLLELAGKTFGVVGFGQIGAAVTRIAQAFGMNVLVSTRTPADHPELVQGRYPVVSVDELFQQSDVISLHCPLTAETSRLVNGERLAGMKAGAILINTGRGPLLDEQAVADALQRGQLGALLVDVLSTEPPGADNPLLTAPNCLITPHIAWATLAARQRLMATVVANVRAFLAGTPQNQVN
ncbi:MAG: D-2-hydroxyacid dehydrogenase [Desulfuromonadaceae bacterium]|nr:D-2-hydroxyacid dehydrogenase [Desulfuromonadaceae bacterium]